MCPMLPPESLAAGQDQAKPRGIRQTLLSPTAVLVIIQQKINTSRCHPRAAAGRTQSWQEAAPACDRQLVSGKRNLEVLV